jgi:hypothetical protein
LLYDYQNVFSSMKTEVEFCLPDVVFKVN